MGNVPPPKFCWLLKGGGGVFPPFLEKKLKKSKVFCWACFFFKKIPKVGGGSEFNLWGIWGFFFSFFLRQLAFVPPTIGGFGGAKKGFFFGWFGVHPWGEKKSFNRVYKKNFFVGGWFWKVWLPQLVQKK